MQRHLISFVDEKGADDPVTRALWVQEVTRRGVLILTTFSFERASGRAQ
jgi:glutamate-1-semialdehyde 2,1-aminomutase/spore coat polysaccharide biosynthesis protein SpsF